MVLSLVGISLLHYLTDIHLIPYHSIYRSVYYIPIAIGAVKYGKRGGIATALTTSALYLPHVMLSWGLMPTDAFNDLLENAVFLFVGAFAGTLADAERKQRQWAQEVAQQLAASNAALTQEVELSERMRGLVTSIVESIDSGILTIDQEQRVTLMNPSAQRIVGASVTSTDDLPLIIRHYLHPETRKYHVATLGERTYGLQAAPLIGARQEEIGRVLVIDDVTEQRALEEHVQRAQRLVALGRLAGGLAHEIRNPLSITRAAAQMLALHLGKDATSAEYTAVIQTEIDRVDRLIEQLLTYARPAVVHRAPTDVGELIRHTISLVQPYATQQQVYLALDLTADLPLLYADSELVHQALVNLLLNAVQATPPAGSVHIRAVADPDTPTIHVSVADTGHGIADADRAHIFDPFFTTRDDGTGLGLSIVQHIVHEHGGTIDVQSEPGQGTRCILHLPLGREDSLSS